MSQTAVIQDARTLQNARPPRSFRISRETSGTGDRRMHVGCFCFDHPEQIINHQTDRIEGYVSFMGEEARHVSSPDELPGASFLLTNVFRNPVSDGRITWLTSAYLGEEIEKMARRHGFCTASGIASFGAMMFDRCRMLYAAMTGERTPGLPKGGLRFGVQTIFGQAPSLVTRGVAEALRASTVNYVSVEKSADSFTFQADPFDHTTSVLRTALPLGTFTRVDQQTLNAASVSQEATAAYLEKSTPGIYRVAVLDIPNAVGRLLSLDDRIPRGADMMNGLWFPSNELAFLVHYTRPVLLEGYVAQDTWYPDLDSTIRTVFPGYARYSVSCGIVLENIWSGLAVSSFPLHMTGPFVRCNACAPFLRAADRICLLRKAIRMYNMGFSIFGYGAGKIRVALGPYDTEQIYAAARETRTWPVVITEDSCITRRDIAAPESDPYMDPAYLYASGDMAELFAQDEAVCRRVLEHAQTVREERLVTLQQFREQSFGVVREPIRLPEEPSVKTSALSDGSADRDGQTGVRDASVREAFLGASVQDTASPAETGTPCPCDPVASDAPADPTDHAGPDDHSAPVRQTERGGTVADAAATAAHPDGHEDTHKKAHPTSQDASVMADAAQTPGETAEKNGAMCGTDDTAAAAKGEMAAAEKDRDVMGGTGDTTGKKNDAGDLGKRTDVTDRGNQMTETDDHEDAHEEAHTTSPGGVVRSDVRRESEKDRAEHRNRPAQVQGSQRVPQDGTGRLPALTGAHRERSGTARTDSTVQGERMQPTR